MACCCRKLLALVVATAAGGAAAADSWGSARWTAAAAFSCMENGARLRSRFCTEASSCRR